MKLCVASKLAEANHPVVVPTQWLPVLLAANTPVPPTNHRRLLDLITTNVELKTAVDEYTVNPVDAQDTYGPIENWDVSGITDMEDLFSGLEDFDADISGWNTSGVTSMKRMFKVRALAPASSRALPCMPLTPQPLAALSLPPPRAPRSRFVPSLATRQGAGNFNQPLSFDTAKVTEMGRMFQVRTPSPRPPAEPFPACR